LEYFSPLVPWEVERSRALTGPIGTVSIKCDRMTLFRATVDRKVGKQLLLWPGQKERPVRKK
jgi:hypothetical protein